MTTSSKAAIFSRILGSEKPLLSPDAARSILTPDFNATDRQRLNAHAAKARKGTLATNEDEELENCLRVDDLLAIVQSRARLTLHHSISHS